MIKNQTQAAPSLEDTACSKAQMRLSSVSAVSSWEDARCYKKMAPATAAEAKASLKLAVMLAAAWGRTLLLPRYWARGDLGPLLQGWPVTVEYEDFAHFVHAWGDVGILRGGGEQPHGEHGQHGRGQVGRRLRSD